MTTKSQRKRPSKAAPLTTAPSAPNAVDPATEGQRLLLAVPETHDAIAKRVGASKQAVSYWRRGEKLPGAPARAALRTAYSIDTAAWDRVPSCAAPPPARPATPPDPSEPLQSPIEIAETQLRMLLELQRNEPDQAPAARVKLAAEIRGMNRDRMALLDKTRTIAVQFWESHSGVAFLEALLDVLTDFPEAKQRVIELCERVIGADR